MVELSAAKNAEIKYSTVQNWYPGDAEGKGGIYNFVTKRALCHGANSKVSWTQVCIFQTSSACVCMLCDISALLSFRRCIVALQCLLKWVARILTCSSALSQFRTSFSMQVTYQQNCLSVACMDAAAESVQKGRF